MSSLIVFHLLSIRSLSSFNEWLLFDLILSFNPSQSYYFLSDNSNPYSTNDGDYFPCNNIKNHANTPVRLTL